MRTIFMNSGSLIVLFILLFSCSGRIEKEWKVDEFSKIQKFSVVVPKNNNVSNVNIYLKGNIQGSLYLGRTKNDTVFVYSGDGLPKGSIFMDFYGGAFDLYLFPSDARGNLKIKVEIPYHKNLF